MRRSRSLADIEPWPAAERRLTALIMLVVPIRISVAGPKNGMHCACGSDSARRVVPAVYEKKNMADQIDFSAPAELRKWISLRNERVMSASNVSPYLVLTGTLSECIRAFMAKPASQQHLYEIHTAAQPPLLTAVLQTDLIAELALRAHRENPPSS